MSILKLPFTSVLPQQIAPGTPTVMHTLPSGAPVALSVTLPYTPSVVFGGVGWMFTLPVGAGGGVGVGAGVGTGVGRGVGTGVGRGVGGCVGSAVGSWVGAVVGLSAGAVVCAVVGAVVAAGVAAVVGTAVVFARPSGDGLLSMTVAGWMHPTRVLSANTTAPMSARLGAIKNELPFLNKTRRPANCIEGAARPGQARDGDTELIVHIRASYSI